MKTFALLLLASIIAMQQLPAQMPNITYNIVGSNNKTSYAPLPLFINGAGQVYPFADGKMLRVGGRYQLVAVPDHGYVFSGWTKVNVFTFTEITVDAGGVVNPPVTSTVLSPAPTNITNPVLEFTMQPEEVIYDVPGVRILSASSGWEANFMPLKKNKP